MDVAVLPKTFAIPDWVALGLADGELRIFGGVVRNAAGQIVLHLKDAGMAKEAARAAAKAARKAVDAGAGKGKLTALGIAAVGLQGAHVVAVHAPAVVVGLLDLSPPDMSAPRPQTAISAATVSYTHLRAHETPEHLVCRLLLEKKHHPRFTLSSPA